MSYHLSPNDEFLTSSMRGRDQGRDLAQHVRSVAAVQAQGHWLQYRLKVTGCSTVQFKVVSMHSEQPIYMCSALPLIGFPSTDLETIPMFVCLMMALSSLEGRQSSALCPHVVSQAAQHFRSTERQATCDGCFSCYSICSVISLHSGMSTASGQKSTVFEGGCWPSMHASLGFQFHFL